MHIPLNRRLALLIDAENVDYRLANCLMQEVVRHGEPIVRRAYGNFRMEKLRDWAEACPRLGIRPQHIEVRTKRKNAADIALAIDAMDLLHGGVVQGFCLVSSDSDFSGLVLRLREHGAYIVGLGQSKTLECFRQACPEFIEIESLPGAMDVLAATVPAVEAAASPKIATIAPKTAPPLAGDKKLAANDRNMLTEAFAKCLSQGAHAVTNDALMSELRKARPAFKLAQSGHSRLQSFLEAGGFSVTKNGKHLLISRPS